MNFSVEFSDLQKLKKSLPLSRRMENQFTSPGQTQASVSIRT